MKKDLFEKGELAKDWKGNFIRIRRRDDVDDKEAYVYNILETRRTYWAFKKHLKKIDKIKQERMELLAISGNKRR